MLKLQNEFDKYDEIVARYFLISRVIVELGKRGIYNLVTWKFEISWM
jgi:hypothetical protein